MYGYNSVNRGTLMNLGVPPSSGPQHRGIVWASNGFAGPHVENAADVTLRNGTSHAGLQLAPTYQDFPNAQNSFSMQQPPPSHIQYGSYAASPNTDASPCWSHSMPEYVVLQPQAEVSHPGVMMPRFPGLSTQRQGDHLDYAIYQQPFPIQLENPSQSPAPVIYPLRQTLQRPPTTDFTTLERQARQARQSQLERNTLSDEIAALKVEQSRLISVIATKDKVVKSMTAACKRLQTKNQDLTLKLEVGDALASLLRRSCDREAMGRGYYMAQVKLKDKMLEKLQPSFSADKRTFTFDITTWHKVKEGVSNLRTENWQLKASMSKKTAEYQELLEKYRKLRTENLGLVADDPDLG
ncbi:uncharacterized protein RAG0_04988 [Rhynchosporium agropyri]|uniref:Uncharacterized protein n=1 Tax=Rhynchosporium agropyri TaxID=914238 RepID=A0A1E1KB76_9HELO|nr:uncharacterized protein RAG0_04988 [Rhynchosporium agropyri]